MVATFNGWDDMPEVEREALEQWERAALLPTTVTTHDSTGRTE
jgi:hypothetical protein